MSTPSPRPRGILFDAYGTLLDIYSVKQLGEELFPGKGDALSTLWRDKQVMAIAFSLRRAALLQ